MLNNFPVRCQAKIAMGGEHKAPNISLLYWYYFTAFWDGQKKRKTFWSCSLIPICMNMPSMSAETAMGFSLKRSKIPNKKLRWSGTDSSYELNDKPLILEATLATRLTTPGLFGLVTGWWGRCQNVCRLWRQEGYRFNLAFVKMGGQQFAVKI